MQSLDALPFIAGSLALDFTNTAEERGHPLCGDVLHTPADLGTWGQRYGILDRGATSRAPAEELRRAREARELLYRLWYTRVHETGARPEDLTLLGQLAAEAYGAGTFAADDDGRARWRWDPADLTSVRHRAVISAVELVQSLPSQRLKQCPGDHCGWFFLDSTKRGNRRWCEMSECGQAAKNAQRRGHGQS